MTTDDLTQLGHDFWAWRAETRPVNRDDVQRLTQPSGWTPDWSSQAIEARRGRLAELDARWQELADPGAPVPDQVDHRLLGSALARVRWELDGVRSWRRDPVFYVDQTVTTFAEALIPPPPFTADRVRDLRARLASIPRTIESARANLDQPVAPLARLAIADLDGIRPRLLAAAQEVHPLLPPGSAPLAETAAQAADALESYQAWLQAGLGSMSGSLALGRDAYLRFLREVALIPYTPEELLGMGRAELARATAFEAYASEAARGALPPLAPDQAGQAARLAEAERALRRGLAERGVLSIPDQIPHYVYLPLPSYLAALDGFGEQTDFPSPARLNETSLRYVPPPDPSLGFFAQVMARDPRPHTAHEGVPGHGFQLALSQRHPDEIRRHWYDSGVNEGLATYAEELVLQAGLLDDGAWAREAVYRFLRLRALRVEVDVQLATGGFTIDQAADYLRTTVPTDARTARDEAASYACQPGFAIGYLIGKLQITQFLADARRQQGDAFRLRDFHDFLWRNGNVPIALQRWEYLGRRDDLDRLSASRA